jgi:hypothetical protein
MLQFVYFGLEDIVHRSHGWRRGIRGGLSRWEWNRRLSNDLPPDSRPCIGHRTRKLHVISICVCHNGAVLSKSINLGDAAEYPTCHMAYIAPNLIALSPPVPVLRYIIQYLVNTPRAEQMPLHKVRVGMEYWNFGID